MEYSARHHNLAIINELAYRQALHTVTTSPTITTYQFPSESKFCVWQTVCKIWVFELTMEVSANEISSFGSHAMCVNPVIRFRAYVIACFQWQYGRRLLI